MFSQVISVFLSTTFDPYVAAKLGSGVTRLAFSTHDEEPEPLTLSNLSVPVVFSLPATDYTLKNGQAGAPQGVEAACVFWDETLRMYRRVC